MAFLSREEVDLVQRYFTSIRLKPRLKYCQNCRNEQPSAPPSSVNGALRHRDDYEYVAGRICLVCGWSMERGRQIDHELWLKVVAADSGECVYCGGQRRICVDHVRALSNGGTDDWDNLVAACWSCNVRKGNRPPMAMLFGRFRKH